VSRVIGGALVLLVLVPAPAAVAVGHHARFLRIGQRCSPHHQRAYHDVGLTCARTRRHAGGYRLRRWHPRRRPPIAPGLLTPPPVTAATVPATLARPPVNAPTGFGLSAGQQLTGGQQVTSANRQYHLVMQGDGNLVLYTQSRALWNSRTDGHPGARAIMQSDGNLVVYDPENHPLFDTRTAGHPGAGLAVQDDGNAVLYQAGRAIWASNTVNSLIAPGETLTAGQFVSAPGEGHRFVMQGDGSLVLYDARGQAQWASNTAGHPGARAIMQTDGNLVVYLNSSPLFSSATDRHPGARLVAQDDGNVVIYLGSTALWATNSAPSQPTPPGTGTGAGTCPDSPGAGDSVTRWNPVVSCVLGLLHQPQDAATINDVDIIIRNESGGNPRAINNWDSNAQHGDPSRGLMQTIGATFEAHRDPALADDSYDPAANIYAGAAYGISRYGSIAGIPGVRSVNAGGRYLSY